MAELSQVELATKSWTQCGSTPVELGDSKRFQHRSFTRRPILRGRAATALPYREVLRSVWRSYCGPIRWFYRPWLGCPYRRTATVRMPIL